MLSQSRRRLAWFSPVPPVRSGVAGRSAALVDELRRDHDIDVYVDEPVARAASGVRSAHAFVWRHQQQPYDLTVFQFGNSSAHDYAWPYAFRYPGLVVLHDTCLHHARAALLLRSGRADDYRAEFRWNHPGRDAALAELAVKGYDSPLYYEWPMVRALVSTARLAAAHGEAAVHALRARIAADTAQPAPEMASVRLGEGDPVDPETARAARVRLRARYGIDEEAIVFGVFGGLTPEKRVPEILEAFRAVQPYAPRAHLLLAGAPAAHYDLSTEIGAAERIAVTGYLETDDELTAHLAACDVGLHLRWPTAGETSGPWLRALAAARPTIVTDLPHLAHVPSLDPRTWMLNRIVDAVLPDVDCQSSPDGHCSMRAGPHPHARSLAASGSLGPQALLRPPFSPVCIAIDILDEDHSLRLAMRRLAGDADLRTSLGRAAVAWWTREHAPAVMFADYRRVIAEAIARPVPAVELPAHVRADGRARLRELMAPFGALTRLEPLDR